MNNLILDCGMKSSGSGRISSTDIKVRTVFFAVRTFYGMPSFNLLQDDHFHSSSLNTDLDIVRDF